MCSNTSSKTWTPLPDCFIDEHLVEMFPLFDQARLQLFNVVTNPDVIHTLLQLPSNHTVNTAPYPLSCLDTFIKTRYFADNPMFIVYINCLRGLCQQNVTTKTMTAVTYAAYILETDIFCHRYSKTNNYAMR